MTLKEHKKHGDTVKPMGGKFNSKEVAFIGTVCDKINPFAEKIATQLKPLAVGYADANHKANANLLSYSAIYTDDIAYHNINVADQNFSFNLKWVFGNSDLVLVNGNHFEAQNQIVFIDEIKKESLQKKLQKLTNVWCFILAEPKIKVFDFLLHAIPDAENIPVFSIHQIAEISEFIQKKLVCPPLFGLVLAGGKSLRMGTDKTKIVYHKKPQFEHVADSISPWCEKTFISSSQIIGISYNVLPDTFLNLGPFGGICSALRHNPNAAWLTVASDMPLLTKETISFLVKNRKPSKMATCFLNPKTGFAEPLITIWEPRAYARLLWFLSLGYSCPRKVLINSDVELLTLHNPDELLNANTPEEQKQLKKYLKNISK